MAPSPVPTTVRASLSELVRYFLSLGTFGFGGPVALIGLAVLWRCKVPEPILVVGAGIVGLNAFPLFRP